MHIRSVRQVRRCIIAKSPSDALTDDKLGAPVPRQALAAQVADRLRDLIIDGTLGTGARINESELGPKLGVSRTPLREALRTLAGEGLIELVPAKGAIVRRFTVEDVRHMLEAIATLETAAARLGIARADPDSVQSVLTMHRAMMAAYRKGDRLTYFKRNQAIHSAIVALAGNPTLCELHARVQDRLKRVRFVGHGGPERWAAAVAEHEAMADALEMRDGDALANALARHMDATFERVRGFVEPVEDADKKP